MKFCLISLLFLFQTLLISQKEKTVWPVLKHYDQNHLLNIALPLGGIGTGTVSLGGRGELRDWEIMNKPAKKFSTITDGNQAPFFSIYIKPKSKNPLTRALLGPLHASEYMHYEGRPVNHHGLPRFSKASFDAAYPFGRVNLSDPSLPVAVSLKAFNPLIPADIHASSIPIAVLTYEVKNLSTEKMQVAVCGTMRNFIGIDGSKSQKNWKADIVYIGANKNQNEYKSTKDFSGIYMWSKGVDSNDPAWGTMALTTPNGDGITHRRSSTLNDWENSILDFWDDFSEDGLLTDKEKIVDDNPMASLSVMKTIEPNATALFTFYLTWHFPNRLDWNQAWTFGYKGGKIGNYYTNQYRDAWDVIEKEYTNLDQYERKSKQFVQSLIKSSIPEVIKESSLFNLSTLRSQTVFRLPSGHLMGWEGTMDEAGSCYGSCTHVWNYEQATAFLFGDLAKSMREVELDFGSKENGKMMNRVNLPLEENYKIDHIAAADGQMGSIMRFYREWLLSGDINWLKKYWPKVKSAMSYAWIENGWDEDKDGVQEGRQHNTMDVDYFGPNPQMQFWYFGALKATADMAVTMEDQSFADTCLAIYRMGSEWVDSNLFNGEYYEQKITDPKSKKFILMDGIDNNIPDYQLGKGCLVDQLVGQYMAHILGLGYLAEPKNIKTTLKTIMKYNYVKSFNGIFNNMRSYVMHDESGLIMASWPKGRLKVPFPYFAESMSGFEYTAAIGMMYEGMNDDGIKCITSIRNRFDGEKRNPFDEPECGHHYARAMASWAGILVTTDFHYSGVKEEMEITNKQGQYFWSNGYAWGTFEIKKIDIKNQITIHIHHGELKLKTIKIKDNKPINLKNDNSIYSAGQKIQVSI